MSINNSGSTMKSELTPSVNIYANNMGGNGSNLQNSIEKDWILMYNVENGILSSHRLIDRRRYEDTTDTFAETLGYTLYVL